MCEVVKSGFGQFSVIQLEEEAQKYREKVAAIEQHLQMIKKEKECNPCQRKGHKSPITNSADGSPLPRDGKEWMLQRQSTVSPNNNKIESSKPHSALATAPLLFLPTPAKQLADSELLASIRDDGELSSPIQDHITSILKAVPLFQEEEKVDEEKAEAGEAAEISHPPEAQPLSVRAESVKAAGETIDRRQQAVGDGGDSYPDAKQRIFDALSPARLSPPEMAAQPLRDQNFDHVCSQVTAYLTEHHPDSVPLADVGQHLVYALGRPRYDECLKQHGMMDTASGQRPSLMKMVGSIPGVEIAQTSRGHPQCWLSAEPLSPIASSSVGYPGSRTSSPCGKALPLPVSPTIPPAPAAPVAPTSPLTSPPPHPPVGLMGPLPQPTYFPYAPYPPMCYPSYPGYPVPFWAYSPPAVVVVAPRSPSQTSPSSDLLKVPRNKQLKTLIAFLEQRQGCCKVSDIRDPETKAITLFPPNPKYEEVKAGDFIRYMKTVSALEVTPVENSKEDYYLKLRFFLPSSDRSCASSDSVGENDAVKPPAHTPTRIKAMDVSTLLSSRASPLPPQPY